MRGGWVTEAAQEWCKVTQGIAHMPMLGRRLKPLVDLHGWTAVLPAWQRYLRATEPRFLSAARFVETYGQYSRSERPPRPAYHAEPEVRQPLDVAKLREMVK